MSEITRRRATTNASDRAMRPLAYARKGVRDVLDHRHRIERRVGERRRNVWTASIIDLRTRNEPETRRL